ncbi:hypothetical protein IPV08_24285, partial [Methylobacterium sp. SD274]|uniref:Ig-like domain-containing protein n=1 Tax=Methylobacterium sp. SD274 TaxID=2782009 RepID=UPI001A95EBDE
MATVTIALNDSALKIGETGQVTITFSEAVDGFELTDLSADNGTLSDLSTASTDQGTGAVTYTATLIPSENAEDATNVVRLADTYTFSAGGNGIPAQSDNFTVDTKAPTVASITAADTSLNV